jgi:hypothetical protein
MLSANTEAYELLKNNINKIDWYVLQSNENLKILELLKEYPEKINWTKLSNNKTIFQIVNNTKLIDKVLSTILT